MASVSAPGLKAGHWWSLFTSLFFATNLLAYVAAALMILLLLGLAERQLGTRRTAVFFFAGQFAAVTLFLLVTQLARYAGDGWLGLMVDARLIGPYAAVLAVSLASSGLLPTLWQRRLRTAVAVRLAPAGALRRARRRPSSGSRGHWPGWRPAGGSRATRAPCTGTAPPAARPGTCSPSPWRSSPSDPS